MIARTFYEKIKNVNKIEIKKERTGEKAENIYIQIAGKKLYIKKSMNNFTKYDKIENSKGPIVFETYYEVKENTHNLDKKKVVENISKELINEITLNFDRNVKVVDKIINHSEENGKIKVRVLLVAEENIALPEKIIDES
ncbi:stage IV sporulation protein [Clostridium tetanomorphum]|nr:stage IV sporulation protein [Clostridium tetanomorphum]